MLSDAGGLGMSLAAITLATGGAAAAHRTYGWYRLEILASLVNTVLLFAVAAYVVYGAIQRWGGDHEVAAAPMIVVAVVASWSTWSASGCSRPARRRASTCAVPTSRSSPTPSDRWACSSAPASSR